MLIEFTVGNFRSFKDPVTLSMVAANITAKNKTVDQENTFQQGNHRLLKSAAIYGANASGKSNLIAALNFMKGFVLNSTSTNSEDPIKTQPFLLNTETPNQPSHFEAVFQTKGIRYRYGFEISNQKVHAEWLYRTIKRETELFWREDNSIQLKSSFKEGRGLIERTRPNALFLSVSDQWNGEIATSIVHWFKNTAIISGIQDNVYLDFTMDSYFQDESIQKQIDDYMQQMDLGIYGINAQRTKSTPEFLTKFLNEIDGKVPDEYKARLADKNNWDITSFYIQHQKFDELGNSTGLVNFDLSEHESEGTKKAFALSGPILHTLQHGRVLFVDELDARLHPLMTRYIIQLFNSSITNPNNAQLIFATHDTNLLDRNLFRRDQIWFAEKDKHGATDLYSLLEYKNVRNDASYEPDYIAGKYGAIPYLGNITHLIGANHGET